MPSVLGTFLSCLHPTARLACPLVIIAGAIHVIVISLRNKRFHWPIAIAWVVLLALAAWSGSLRYSPLQFGSRRLPVLRGFEIRSFNRVPVTITPGQVVSAAPGLPLVIHPETIPVPIDCRWFASAGGALDDPRSCDTVYVAPNGVPSEILRLRVQPACGLPPAVAEFKISIMP